MMGWESDISQIENGSRLGLDVGSRSTKYAFHVDGELILGRIDTTDFIFQNMAGKLPTDIEMVSTGYGRNKVTSTRQIPEIRAHTVGALRSLEIDTFTLLDIGGQDFKVVRVENSAIKDFHMNDKCAAGTGRFLEKMAEMLHLKVEELGSHTGNSRVLESTCSVFTETELISLMMEGSTKADLAGGVVFSVYERIRPYLRMYPSDTIVFTGGVARCTGLVKTISEGLSADVIVPDRAQFMGALGSLYSRKR
jgi:(R)-2-hydroxyacyl-CoA dehydratese activating ATPase